MTTQIKIVHENATLAIIKQGKVIQCLAILSCVLSMGLKVSSPNKDPLSTHVETHDTIAYCLELNPSLEPNLHTTN